MTWRAILLGLLSGVLIAGFGYLNDSIFRLNSIVGNHFPISVFGALVCVALGLNPVLRRLRPGLAFRPAELVLIVALALAAGTLVAVLAHLGLDWPFALLLVSLMLMMFLVIARVSAEAGLIHIETNWNALGVMLGGFGVAALGPKAMVIAGLICAMLMVDVREAVMPFVTNGLKMCDDEHLPPGRVAGWGILVFTGGLLLAVPVVLAAIYSAGVPLWDGWGSYAVPQFAFERASLALTRLDAVGLLSASQGYSWFERLRHLQPEPMFLWAAGAGAGLVLVCSFLRLPRWPLHPVVFVSWTTWPLLNFSHSFLLGWLLKQAVTRFGGQSLYRRVLPALIGVIAGDILAGLLFMAIGALYHAHTGTPAPWYRVFPG